MSCQACGGDGQIEYGAYRGDDSTETRECRLCGGAVTVYSASTDVVGTVESSAASAGESLKRLGQAAAKASMPFVVTSREDYMQRRRTMKTAKQYADERLEQLRQENEQRQREAESALKSSSPSSAIMNRIIRDSMREP